MTPKPLFVHIPKSAGTALLHHYVRLMGPDKVLHTYIGLDKPKQLMNSFLAKAASNPQEAAGDVKIALGHDADLAIPCLLSNDFKLVTLVRDPTEYLISQYNHIKFRPIEDDLSGRTEAQYKQDQAVRGEFSLEDLLDETEPNPQCQFLCKQLSIAVESNADINQEAVEQIIDRLFLIGTVDKLEPFNFISSFIFELPLEPVQVKNASNNRKAEFVSYRTREAIHEKFEMDMLLYNRAERKFDDKFAEIMGISQNVRKAWENHSANVANTTFSNVDDALLQKLNEYTVLLRYVDDLEARLESQKQELELLRGMVT